jgi:hypothetical protein
MTQGLRGQANENRARQKGCKAGLQAGREAGRVVDFRTNERQEESSTSGVHRKRKTPFMTGDGVIALCGSVE